MHYTCLIGLGSNQGNRLQALQDTYDLLQQILTDTKHSLIYETKALLPKNTSTIISSKPYLNMVVYGKTKLTPQELLKALKAIELQMGRDQHSPKWSPRIMDCDILLYENIKMKTPTLTIPHPEFTKRFFALIPAAQLAPQWIHPIKNEPLIDIARQLPSNQFLKTFVLNPKFLGIVNVTPDSFSDGGQFFNPEKAIKQAGALWEEGASVIDFGAQSTKPSAKAISWTEEWFRLEPVLSGFTSKYPTAQISIDTFRYEVAKRALSQYNIHWINDISGKLDPKMLQLIANHGCKYVLTFNQPTQSKTLTDMIYCANEQIALCESYGLHKNQIIFDPGVGFNKSPLDTFWLLNQIGELKKLGVKILVGISRKPFWRVCLDDPNHQADMSSVIIAQTLKNIDYLRVHDIRAHQRGFTLQKLVSLFSVAK